MRVRRGFIRTARASRFSFVSVGGTLLGALGAFLSAVVAARTLDRSAFAAFGLGLAVNSLIVQLADLGMNALTVAETAPDTRAGRRASTTEKLRRLALARVASAAGVAAAASVVALLIPSAGPYRAAVVIGSSGAVFGSIALFFVAALQGALSFGRAATLAAAQGTMRLVLVAACGAAGLGQAAMLTAYAILAPFGTIVLGAVLLLKLHGGRNGLPVRQSVELDRRLRRALAIVGLSSSVLLNGDVLLLVLLSSRVNLAIYVGAWRIAASVLLLNNAVTYSLFPHVMAAQDVWKEGRRLFLLGIALASGLLALVPFVAVAGLAVLGPAGRGSFWPLVTLLCAFSIDMFVVVASEIFYRVGRAHILAVIAAVETIIMMSVTVVLRGEGAMAPALGQLAARVAGALMVAVPLVLVRDGHVAWFGGRRQA